MTRRARTSLSFRAVITLKRKGQTMRIPARFIAVASLPLIVALAAFAIAMSFAPARAGAAAAADDKDWKVLGETKIKDAKDAASSGSGGGGTKDRKQNDKKKDGAKKDGGD